MSFFAPIVFDDSTDRNVRVLVDDVVVVVSTAESEYARALNFIGERFTVVDNTVGSIKTYDISLTYPDRIIVYEGGIAQGSEPGLLNFDDTHFDVSPLTGGMYTVTDTAYGQVFVNAFTTPHKLNISNATNHEAVTIAEDGGNDEVDLVFFNNEVDVYSNGTLVNTTGPRALNFSTEFTATDDSGNDRVTVALTPTTPGGTAYVPTPNNKVWGIMMRHSGTDAGVQGSGMLNLDVSTIANGGDVTAEADNDGTYFRMTVADNDDAVGYTTGDNFTRRAFSPHLKGKLKVPNSNGNYRVWCGFSAGVVADNNNTFLASGQEGFGLCVAIDSGGDTNWMIRRNDNSGTVVSTSTGVAESSAAVFTFELKAEPNASPSPRWGFNINGGAFTWYTADIPQANTNLRFTFRIEGISATADQSVDCYYLYFEADK